MHCHPNKILMFQWNSCWKVCTFTIKLVIFSSASDVRKQWSKADVFSKTICLALQYVLHVCGIKSKFNGERQQTLAAVEELDFIRQTRNTNWKAELIFPAKCTSKARGAGSTGAAGAVVLTVRCPKSSGATRRQVAALFATWKDKGHYLLSYYCWP